MSYSIIQPPFTMRFREMPKRELAAYAAWFHKVIPERIAEVTKAVKVTPGYEGWGPSATPDSLEALGRWLEGQVETRERTDDEIAETRAALTFPINPSGQELTNRTFSLAMDIGMYFAEVVLKNLAGTRWTQPLENKKLADYGQPVVTGFGALMLNPVRVMVTTAYAISRKKPAELRALYDTWARMTR